MNIFLVIRLLFFAENAVGGNALVLFDFEIGRSGWNIMSGAAVRSHKSVFRVLADWRLNSQVTYG